MGKAEKESGAISVQALQRLPYYLQYLKKLQETGIEIVAAPEVAEVLQLNEVQVRKDFAAVSTSKGKPKVGFSVDGMIAGIEETLGYNNTHDAVLVGVGSLGKALISYPGFAECGLRIVAGFDSDSKLVGRKVCGKEVLPVRDLGRVCSERNVRIGIIAVPAHAAQSVCNCMVEGGIEAVWNFAPLHLNVPGNIMVKNENLATSLAILSNHLKNKT